MGGLVKPVRVLRQRKDRRWGIREPNGRLARSFKQAREPVFLREITRRHLGKAGGEENVIRFRKTFPAGVRKNVSELVF